MNESTHPHEPSQAGTPVRGIVLTHGTMCSGMVDAVQKITGVGDDVLMAVSNDGKGPDELFRTVQAAAGQGPALIFTDLPSGSCALAARFVCRDPGVRAVVFGTNLPMLLEFVFHRTLPIEELEARLVEKGRAGIRAMEREPAGADRSVSRR